MTCTNNQPCNIYPCSEVVLQLVLIGEQIIFQFSLMSLLDETKMQAVKEGGSNKLQVTDPYQSQTRMLIVVYQKVTEKP